jgi:hypothetical protein
LFDLLKMCTLASMTGVFVPSWCCITKAVLRCHPADVSALERHAKRAGSFLV